MSGSPEGGNKPKWFRAIVSILVLAAAVIVGAAFIIGATTNLELSTGRPLGIQAVPTAHSSHLGGGRREEISNSWRPHNHPADGVERMPSPSKLIADRSDAAPPSRP